MRKLPLFLLAGLTLTFGATAHAFTAKQLTPKIRAAIKSNPGVPADMKKGLKITFYGKGPVRHFEASNFKIEDKTAHPGGNVVGTVDLKLGTVTIGDHIDVEYPKPAPVAATPAVAPAAVAAPVAQ